MSTCFNMPYLTGTGVRRIPAGNIGAVCWIRDRKGAIVLQIGGPIVNIWRLIFVDVLVYGNNSA